MFMPGEQSQEAAALEAGKMAAAAEGKAAPAGMAQLQQGSFTVDSANQPQSSNFYYFTPKQTKQCFCAVVQRKSINDHATAGLQWTLETTFML